MAPNALRHSRRLNHSVRLTALLYSFLVRYDIQSPETLSSSLALDVIASRVNLIISQTILNSLTVSYCLEDSRNVESQDCDTLPIASVKLRMCLKTESRKLAMEEDSKSGVSPAILTKASIDHHTFQLFPGTSHLQASSSSLADPSIGGIDNKEIRSCRSRTGELIAMLSSTSGP